MGDDMLAGAFKVGSEPRQKRTTLEDVLTKG